MLTAPLILVAALLIFLEDFLWDELARLLGVLARLPLWARLERWIKGLPAWAALPLFLVPMVVLFPLKIAALWLMTNHHVVLGLQIILLAKIAGTAIAARLFLLLKPTLLTVAWFARAYEWVTRWKARVMARLHQMYGWRLAAAMMLGLKRRWRGYASRAGLLTRLKQLLRKRGTDTE
ncbi:hypothetical protein KSF73_13375 [Burkholderiaceae bacterium DAT-1]|nr:hypothetical protein [Burkholderiaceae bacterium DAT-1]